MAGVTGNSTNGTAGSSSLYRSTSYRQRFPRRHIEEAEAGGPGFSVCSFRLVPERWVPRPCVFGKGGYDAADTAAHHGFDEDFVSKSRGVNAVLQASVVPTLRKVREDCAPTQKTSNSIKERGFTRLPEARFARDSQLG